VAASAAQAEPRDPSRERAFPLSAELESSATALYRENFAFVWRNARRLGCGDDWVDDAVHEVFLVATRRLAEFEGRSSERTWLFAITYRVVQRMLRDRARQRQRVTRYAREVPPATGDAQHEAEAAQYLRYLIGLLPKAQQLVLILAELEGFTTAEIAETLGIPPGTVHSRVRAAKLHLTQVIERERERDERSEP
jgi:RNA polymerase sigma-70 factor (ECF subfamily)